MKKLSLPDWFSRLGIWIVPLISITSLPLLLSGWQQGDRPSAPPISTLRPSSPKLPPPSQLNPAASPLPAAPQSLPQSLGVSHSSHQRSTSIPVPSSSAQPKTMVSPRSKAEQVTHQASNHSLATRRHSIKEKNRSASAHSAHRRIAHQYAPPPLEIRVAILQDEPATTIAASQQATIRDRNGKILTSVTGNEGLSVQPQDNALLIGGKAYPSVVWLQPTAGSVIYVGDRWYRGKVLLLSEGSALMAINYVSLEHYLYSVVGSEMHATAPSEALKAQAIAARSYALVHMIRPASDWFDLGNTQRWQVYKGINSEFNTTQQAVTATAGQILSYSGGVVESLYAATDEIVSRAHGGRGMSQTGAYDLAQQGYDYQRILARYYPGVGLARLIVK